MLTAQHIPDSYATAIGGPTVMDVEIGGRVMVAVRSQSPIRSPTGMDHETGVPVMTAS